MKVNLEIIKTPIDRIRAIIRLRPLMKVVGQTV